MVIASKFALLHLSCSRLLFRIFIYQIVNVYTMALSGSVFTALNDIIDSPRQAVSLLALSLPSTTVFFINVILTQSLISVPVRLLRAGALVQWLYMCAVCREARLTVRSLFEGPLYPSSPEYDLMIPGVLFVFCVVMLFWVIAPSVLPFANLFFFIQYVSFKYQSIYEYEQAFETGGKIFVPLFRFSMICLLASSILNITFVSIKNGTVQGPLLIPLPFIICLSWMSTERSFSCLSTSLAFSTAVDMDSNHATGLSGFDPNYYLQLSCRTVPSAEPYPHRKHLAPLFDSNGRIINLQYWNDRKEFEYD